MFHDGTSGQGKESCDTIPDGGNEFAFDGAN
jgi:hypothetical protein